MSEAHTTTSDAAALIREAKRRFCLDPVALRDQDCATCARGAAAPCPLRMREISAVQSQLNRMAADTSEGHRNWRAEYQQDPPPPATKTLIRLDAATVIEARSGLVQRIVPNDVEVLVQGRDVGRHWIHTVALAVSPGRVGRIVDYYATPVESPGGRIVRGTAEGEERQHQVEQAIYMALRELARRDERAPYHQPTREAVPARMTCYDSRYGMHVVRRHCDEWGPAHYAVMGMGTARGTQHWSIPRDVERGKRQARSARDRTYLSYDSNCYMKWAHGNWRFYAHADWYKSHVHGGFLIPAGEPGSLALFDPVNEATGEIYEGPLRAKAHATYAQHVTAEEEEQVAPNVTRWVKTKGREANHYLDATYLCLVAVAILEWFVPRIRLPDVDPAAEAAAGQPQAAPGPARIPEAPTRRERRSRTRGGSAGNRRSFRRSY
jgi:hypothetical protein